MNRTLVLGVFLPVLLFEIGFGALLPVVPLLAMDRGAGAASAAAVVALLGIGQILADVPAGALAARIGDRRAMLLAAAASVVVLVVMALVPGQASLAVGVLALGACNAVFMLARHAYLTETTPVTHRARALSTLGGLNRIGLFLGPFAGAAVMHLAGLNSVIWLSAGAAAAAALVVLAVPDEPGHAAPPAVPAPRVSTWRVVVDHRRLFATLGIAVVMVGAVRAARQTALPLWSDAMGLAPATTSLIFGLSGAADMLLFYPAGKVMDRYGRLWTGIPSMVLLTAGFLLLPLTTDLTGLAWAAVLIGLGNGVGAGILMTLGSDASPPGVRPQFLGVWHLLQDSGSALGPLVVAAGPLVATLSSGIYATAGMSAAAGAALARWAPRYSVHANGTTRRRAREAGHPDF